ncbi:MAG: DUF3179 domain-containing protein [Caldilineae bacterium]|nr:MAG: DUF3179 domain-containing protein [Caldilineae bacterium]
MVYAREVDSYPEPLTFGVSGKLIMNVLVMYDRQTESLWSQILGQAVEGELAGTRLKPLVSLQTTWGQWKELHPDTLVLRKGRAGSYDPYTDYYIRNSAGVLGETRRDDRQPTKAVGIGVVVNEEPAFFPVSKLRDEPVVNDVVGGEPILVTFHAEVATGLVFRRSVEGRVLTFALEEAGGEFTTLVDAETGTRWSAFSGVGLEGPLAGKVLERIPATTSFWFGWKDWHPDTRVYGVDEAPPSS